MKKYTHKTTEDRWQKYWAKEQLYEVETSEETENKFYNLVMYIAVTTVELNRNSNGAISSFKFC
jgi:hypothetical protein